MANITNSLVKNNQKPKFSVAIRSGYYKKLNVLPIKQGELIKFNPLEEEIEIKLIEDDTLREQTETTGYYALFEYTNGFKKAMYWSREKMEAHALKYSQGYRADKQKGTEYTFWSKDFDGMAMKTMLRQLISKWGIMSTELQEAFVKDQAVLENQAIEINHLRKQLLQRPTFEEAIKNSKEKGEE